MNSLFSPINVVAMVLFATALAWQGRIRLRQRAGPRCYERHRRQKTEPREKDQDEERADDELG